MARFLRIGLSIDPPVEKAIPCTEFTVDEDNDTVTVFNGEELWGYFSGVEYAFLEEDGTEDAEDDDDDDDDGYGDEPDDSTGPTGIGGFVETVDVPVLTSLNGGAGSAHLVEYDYSAGEPSGETEADR